MFNLPDKQDYRLKPDEVTKILRVSRAHIDKLMKSKIPIFNICIGSEQVLSIDSERYTRLEGYRNGQINLGYCRGELRSERPCRDVIEPNKYLNLLTTEKGETYDYDRMTDHVTEQQVNHTIQNERN